MLGFSNAKINLGLNIINKRPDGYHNIESVFYPIPWADVLEVLPSESFSFTVSGVPVPGENLVIKAWNLLAPAERNVKIYLHKLLPMGAGIGGGSSNAAFTLKLVNDVLQLNHSPQHLKDLAGTLGSDCPFFIDNQPAFACGKGTELTPVPRLLRGKYVVLVNPGIHISTAEAYAGVTPGKPTTSIHDLIHQPLDRWRGLLTNDFEAPMIRTYPLIGQIKEALYRHGAVYASMTGSGSTLYGIWEKETDLRDHFAPFTYWSGQL